MCGCDAHHDPKATCTCVCSPKYHARPLKVEQDQEERIEAAVRGGQVREEDVALITDGRALALIAVLALLILAVIWIVA